MYYIGIDAGATKTHTILSDGTEIFAEDTSGPANYRAVGWPETIKNIIRGIKSVLEKKKLGNVDINICVGMAGINTPQDQKDAMEKIRKIIGYSKKIKLQVVNDTVVALNSATENKNAISIICGTGSNCYGRNERGDEVWVGGLDYMLSDEASGYMMGLKALHAATKSMDGRSEKTKIEDSVCKKLSISSVKDAQSFVYSLNWTKTDTASCAFCVFEAAKANDTIAKNIINETVDEALLMVKTAKQKLTLAFFDCVCVGGLFEEPLFKARFEERFQIMLPTGKILHAYHTPAWGAVLMAQKLSS